MGRGHLAVRQAPRGAAENGWLRILVGEGLPLPFVDHRCPAGNYSSVTAMPCHLP